MQITKEQMAKYLDHTNLKPNATQADIDQTCQEAKKYNTASVCVNAYWTKYVAQQLEGTDIETCVVVGFPLGATTSATKAFEAKQAIADGAQEIDMVINIGELIAGHDEAVQKDIEEVAQAVHENGQILKVIIETSFLNDEQKVRACKLAQAAGTDFVKTSTGFSSAGATTQDVALMRKTVGPDLGVKASGGIHTFDEAMAMIEAGATRLGVSATIKILEG